MRLVALSRAAQREAGSEVSSKAVRPALRRNTAIRSDISLRKLAGTQKPYCRGLFGASDDSIGADYRACKNFGPLYATNR